MVASVITSVNNCKVHNGNRIHIVIAVPCIIICYRYKKNLVAYRTELTTSTLQYPNDMYTNSDDFIKEYETQVINY